MAEIPKWHASGDWFDVCKCKVPCPCEFAQPPTYGDCDGVLVWHIAEGQYGETSLDALTVVMVGSFEGNLWAGEATGMRSVLFFDERAGDQQREALQMIFSGQAGGTPAELMEIWATEPEILGLEFAPIEVEFGEKLAHWRVKVPGVLEASAKALTGPTTPPDERVQTLNPPGSETGGRVATWGVATMERVETSGFSWDRKGNSSKHIPFDWSGP